MDGISSKVKNYYGSRYDIAYRKKRIFLSPHPGGSPAEESGLVPGENRRGRTIFSGKFFLKDPRQPPCSLVNEQETDASYLPLSRFSPGPVHLP